MANKLTSSQIIDKIKDIAPLEDILQAICYEYCNTTSCEGCASEDDEYECEGCIVGNHDILYNNYKKMEG